MKSVEKLAADYDKVSEYAVFEKDKRRLEVAASHKRVLVRALVKAERKKVA